MTSCETIRHGHISQGIFQAIETFWKLHENEDFQVNIEGECVKCHSFILASCSEFFRSLLRSNMKEKLDMKVDLQNIPLNIFNLILQTLYTGCELLTKDNVLEVWSAVHLLQIHFLILHCEDYVLKNISLETLETYKRQGEFLQSERVSKGIFKFMLENFMTLRSTEVFLRLQFEDLLKLIESDSLVVTSEDLVLHSVYEWINFGEVVNNYNKATLTMSYKETFSRGVTTKFSKMFITGKDIETTKVSASHVNELKVTQVTKSMYESARSSSQIIAIPSVNQNDGSPSVSNNCKDNRRSVYLLPLLKATRYFLLSEACIANLHLAKEIQNNIEDIDIFFKALAYKTCINVNNYLPTAAIHRECSQLDNVGVVCISNSRILAYSFAKKTTHYFPKSTKLNIYRLLALNNQLYACVKKKGFSEMFVLQSVKWVSVLKLEEQVRFCLTHDSSIIIITVQNIYRYKPISPLNKIDVDIGAIDFAISFYQNILLFTTSDLKTKVRCWDTDNNTLSDLAELDFSANNMTSFTDDRSTYILDEDGCLYHVKQLETIQFTFIDRIWSFRAEELRGAIMFRNFLFLCGKFPEKTNLTKTLNDVFSFVWFMKLGSLNFTSNFIYSAISKTDLTGRKISCSRQVFNEVEQKWSEI
ncbi:uncharacterized protein LOC106050446 [Biomphalaria glabrata]|uniref:Uncharacterized protein LOC106050446 n=1 Tax=Biomphalaria glabrata TaxID=6526 RepID=A0A9W3BAM0_BIOGL|nr:uncharacterized protein LOC106050446 [Biomphalaria glabrata]KAI8738658.1 kelch protein 8 [Biomphalaria glabrata]